MAEYRSGNYAAAVQALRAAAAGWTEKLPSDGHVGVLPGDEPVPRREEDEAWKVAIAAAAQMKPLPADEHNPLSRDASHDHLILWLAYKEAKAMIGFEAGTSPTAKTDKN